MHTIISHPRSSLESWGYAPGWPPAVHGISLCKWSVCASAAKPQMQLGLGAAPGGEGTPGSRPPPRCDSGSAARPACETPVRHSCERARKRSQSLAPPRYAALSYQATCMERARLRQRCEQLGDEPLERVLRPRRFPPPRPAARSPRALQPGALRKSGGARCGGRERPFPATAHRAGPGWLPAPGPLLRPPSAGADAGAAAGAAAGGSWRGCAPRPGCPRACAPPPLPYCRCVPAAAGFLNGEPVLLRQHPCAAGRAGELYEAPPSAGGKHGALPPQHPGTCGGDGTAAQPAPAGAPRLGAEILCLWHLHGAPEGHPYVLRDAHAALPPPRYPRSILRYRHVSQKCSLSLRALPALRALRGCGRDGDSGRSESRLVEDLPVFSQPPELPFMNF